MVPYYAARGYNYLTINVNYRHTKIKYRINVIGICLLILFSSLINKERRLLVIKPRNANMEIDYMVLSLVIFVILLVVMFATVKVDYVGAGANNLSRVPVDMLNERNPSGLRKGVNLASLPTTASNNRKSTGAINSSARTANGSVDAVGKNNPSAPKYGLFNLPEKDNYMSPQLREQIDTLRTQYYYDNCQYTLLPHSGGPVPSATSSNIAANSNRK